MNWANEYVRNEINAHCRFADGAVLVVYTPLAMAAYAAALDAAQYPASVRLSDIETVAAEGEARDARVVVLVPGSTGESLTAYARLNFLKDRGLPVVFCMPDRRMARAAPSWENSGVHYEGMFFLASKYAATIMPRKGAYCEFGVYDGRTFILAGHALRDVCGHFYAFDSYRGIGGALKEENTHFADGQYRANIETLEYNIKQSGLSDLKYKIVPGFFEETLAGRSSADEGIGPISVVHIDVDVYRPAKLALDYVTPGLSTGSLLMFDDYDQISARNDRGERRAVREWLVENPHISIESYRNYGVFCRSFIVHIN